MSLISEKWQPACLAGNLKSIRYKRALTSALVKFTLKKSYFHFFISSKFCVLSEVHLRLGGMVNSYYIQFQLM
jgi:hypothetical protein